MGSSYSQTSNEDDIKTLKVKEQWKIKKSDSLRKGEKLNLFQYYNCTHCMCWKNFRERRRTVRDNSEESYFLKQEPISIGNKKFENEGNEHEFSFKDISTQNDSESKIISDNEIEILDYQNYKRIHFKVDNIELNCPKINLNQSSDDDYNHCFHTSQALEVNKPIQNVDITPNNYNLEKNLFTDTSRCDNSFDANNINNNNNNDTSCNVDDEADLGRYSCERDVLLNPMYNNLQKQIIQHQPVNTTNTTHSGKNNNDKVTYSNSQRKLFKQACLVSISSLDYIDDIYEDDDLHYKNDKQNNNFVCDVDLEYQFEPLPKTSPLYNLTYYNNPNDKKKLSSKNLNNGDANGNKGTYGSSELYEESILETPSFDLAPLASMDTIDIGVSMEDVEVIVDDMTSSFDNIDGKLLGSDPMNDRLGYYREYVKENKNRKSYKVNHHSTPRNDVKDCNKSFNYAPKTTEPHSTPTKLPGFLTCKSQSTMPLFDGSSQSPASIHKKLLPTSVTMMPTFHKATKRMLKRQQYSNSTLTNSKCYLNNSQRALHNSSTMALTSTSNLQHNTLPTYSEDGRNPASPVSQTSSHYYSAEAIKDSLQNSFEKIHEDVNGRKEDGYGVIGDNVRLLDTNMHEDIKNYDNVICDRNNIIIEGKNNIYTTNSNISNKNTYDKINCNDNRVMQYNKECVGKEDYVLMSVGSYVGLMRELISCKDTLKKLQKIINTDI